MINIFLFVILKKIVIKKLTNTYDLIMSKKCQIDINKTIMTGNNVSHSKRRTRRRFLLNTQNYSLISEILGGSVMLKATPSSIRTIEHNNGLDNFLLNTPDLKLAKEAIKIKKRIKKALEKREKNKKAIA